MHLLLILFVVLAGLSNPVQSAANAGLNKALGQVVPAALVIYAVALTGLLLCAPFLGVSLRGLGSKAAAAPWWVWLGGICNLMFVLAGALATQKVGSAVFTVTVASCAIALSLVLDSYGLLGLEQHPLTWIRLLGGAMAIGGIALVSIA